MSGFIPLDNIDWSATLDVVQAGAGFVGVLAGLAGAARLLRDKPSAQEMKGSAGGRIGSSIGAALLLLVLRHGWFALAGIAAAVWLAVVALNDKDGFTGQTAAAWVQAVGSVMAIIAAIVIDQGAARRQIEQLRSTESGRLRDRADEALAVVNQAAFAHRYTRETYERMTSPGPAIVPAMVQYDHWREVAADHADALRRLGDRITDPSLLVHVVMITRAVRPPAAMTINPVSKKGHPIDTVRESLHELDDAMPALLAFVEHVVARAEAALRVRIPRP